MKTLKYPAMLLLLLFFLGSFAQFPSAQHHVVTDTNLLDAVEINRLADHLTEYGVAPLLLFIDSKVGDSYEDVDTYLEEAISHYDMATSQGLVDEGLVIFVGTSALRREGGQLPVFIYYGSNLVLPLEQIRPGTTMSQVDYLRENVIIPQLQRGNYTQAFIRALEEVQDIVGIPVLGTVASSANTATVDSSAVQNTNQRVSFPRWLIVALGMAGVFFIVGLIRNHPKAKAAGRQQGPTATPAQYQALQSVKSDLSTLLIDLAGKGDVDSGHDAHIPHDPEQQADMVLIQSLAGVDRPEVVKTLRERYDKMRTKLEAVEQQFAEVSSGEPEQKNDAQATMYLSRYQNMLDEATTVKHFSQELSQVWEDLNQEVQGVKHRLTRAETGLDDLHERYRRMLAPKPSRVSTFTELEQLLSSAQNMVDKDRPLQSVSELDAFDTLLQERSQSLKRYPQLVQGMNKRLEQMDSALAEGRLRIVEGQSIFDKVDDFAEDSWRDIRGNGSAAELALDEAYGFVEAARWSQQQEDFLIADDALSDAQVALGRVEANIKAIETRLYDLESAKRSALESLAGTQREYALLERQAKSFDAEESVREHVLKVISQLGKAQSLADEPRPDWTVVLAEAQEADRLLDDASAALDNERDRQADEQRRLQSEKEEARIALDRISNFVRVHPEVNEDEVERLFEQAEFSFVQAERSQDNNTARAIQLFDEAERDAKRAYDVAESSYARVGRLQRDLEQQQRRIKRKWEEASRLVARNRGARHLQQQLESIERNLPNSRDWQDSSQRTLVRQLEALRRLSSELDTILHQARRLNSSTGANLPSGFPRQNRPSTRVQFPQSTVTRGTRRGGSVFGSAPSMSHTPRTPQPPRQSGGRGYSGIGRTPSLPNRPISINTGSTVNTPKPSKTINISTKQRGGVSRGGWKPSGGMSKGGW